MSNMRQEVIWYRNYDQMAFILQDMRDRIESGWRIHTCLERDCDILVVYEVPVK